MSANQIAASVKQMHNLTEWASGLKFEELPKAVVDRARWVLLDDLGAIICGSLETEVKKLQEIYLKQPREKEATVLTAGFPKTDIFTAAELNGIAGCWVELDEGYRSASSHAGVYTIPALLALAERENATLDQVLTALVVGYEFGARFAEAWSFPRLNIHPHGIFTVISAAAASAKLMGYDKEQFMEVVTTASALTIASPFDHAFRGALVRNMWTGIGARLGLLVAICLSEIQINGLPDSPYSVFSDIYGAAFNEGALNQALGSRYAICNGYHKAYACCAFMHSAVEALLELRRSYSTNGTLPTIDKIVVEIHEKGFALKQVHPTTTLGSKFSLPHAMAAIWILGDGGYRAFTPEMLNDPDVKKLREKVELKLIDKVAPPPADRPARVKLTFADGTSDEAYSTNSLGDPTKPFNEEILKNKFASVTSEALSSSDKVSTYVLTATANRPIVEIFDLLRK